MGIFSRAKIFGIITFLSISPLFICQGYLAADEVLTWEDCILEAKKNNPRLISSGEGIKQQESAKDITVSGLFPQIDADLAAGTAKTSVTDSAAGTTTNSTADTYSYGLSGTQLIFDGFKTISDVKSAAENVKAAQQSYKFTSSAVRLGLRTAFVNLLTAQELISVTEDIKEIRKDNLMLITLRYESGLEHKGALLTAEANFAEANFELARAKRDVESNQRELIRQMGGREFRPLSVKADFGVRDTAEEKPDFDDLVKINPAVLQAAFEKNAALFGVKSSYGNFSPELSGTAGAGKKSRHWPPRNNQWDLGLNLTMPIFEGGLRLAQVSRAYSVYRQAEADEKNARDTAIVNLQRTWAGLQDALEAVEVQGKILDAGRERAKIAEAQYSAGFINFDDWIIIENDLVAAKKAYLQSQATALLAEADWIHAKGETLEYAQ